MASQTAFVTDHAQLSLAVQQPSEHELIVVDAGEYDTVHDRAAAAVEAWPDETEGEEICTAYACLKKKQC